MLTLSAALVLALTSISLMFLIGGLVACLLGGIMLGLAFVIVEKRDDQ